MELCSFHVLKTRYKYSSDRVPPVGAGAVSNDQMKFCYKCKEPISLQRRPNGTWQLLDFFTGQEHEHREEVHKRN
jgi:hypothetical protein